MVEQLPQKFGNYTLHKLIARGGMAEIYRATMPGIGGFEKTVAIKKILPHLAEDEEFVNMLKDEANILVSISDSNIAQVYDLGRIGDSYFIAMEYVHGLDLSQVLKGLKKQNKSIPIDHAIYIASCICAGLHAAHTNTDAQGNPLNIVHRDVSPHNVIISYAGDVKLIDFGVAKAAAKESHTQVGVIKGKLLYMAPEQAMAKTLDGRADLFAAGLCLYKMLTNELPFRGDNEFQIYNNILSKEIVPPRELNPQVPQEVNQIVMTLLQRDPDKRYQDGYNAKQDLRRALHRIAPGYTVNRLGRFIEDNFSAEAIQRQNALRQQALRDTSGPTSMAPMTPSATSLGTGQLLAEAAPDPGAEDTFDTVRAEALQGPPPLHMGAAQPTPAQGLSPGPGGGALRTQKSDERTGQYGLQQLSGPPQLQTEAASPAEAGGARKIPGALKLVTALLVAVAVLFGLTFLGDDAPAPVADITEAPAPAPAPAAVAPPSATVRVHLDSTPSGADLFRGDDLLGTTPQELTLRRSTEPLTISLQKEGYERFDLQIIPDQDMDEVFVLTEAEDSNALETFDDEPAEAQAPAPASAPDTAPTKQRDTPAPPAKDPVAPAKKPAAQPKEPAPSDPGFDLWDDDAPKTNEPKKSSPPRKPASAPKPKSEPKPEKKKDPPSDILNPFG